MSEQLDQIKRGIQVEGLLKMVKAANDALAATLSNAEAMKDSLLTQEQKDAFAAIDEEVAGKRHAARANTDAVIAEINRLVMKNGASISGGGLTAVYKSGSKGWDAKQLEELALIIPEVLEAQKTGEPSVYFKPKLIL
jgi:hypothetical protein